MRYEVDWDSIYAQIPEVMGLPDMRFRGGKWYGPYYMSGCPSTRWDKLVVMRGRRSDKMIIVMEQGGDTITIVSWLVQYGGVAQRDVYRVLSRREHRDYVPVRKEYVGPGKTVEPWRYVEAGGGCRKWKNPLYVFLAGIYGEKRVTDVFRMYGVTDGLRDRRFGVVGTRFWYINRSGEVLYDKTMFYKEDGHRNKDCHPMRQYKVGDGYTQICYFGENLIKEDNKRPVMVVESEKSAIICKLEFPNYQWVACGGLKCLFRLGEIKDRKVWLVPDVDGAEEWMKIGKVWRWWEKMKVGEKWDLADAIMNKYGK